jgi:hypothetical protein
LNSCIIQLILNQNSLVGQFPSKDYVRSSAFSPQGEEQGGRVEAPLASTSTAACAMATHMPCHRGITPRLWVRRMRLFGELVVGAAFSLEMKNKTVTPIKTRPISFPTWQFPSENWIPQECPQGGGCLTPRGLSEYSSLHSVPASVHDSETHSFCFDRRSYS